MDILLRPAELDDVQYVFDRARAIDRLVLTEEAMHRVKSAARCITLVGENGRPLAILGCSVPDDKGLAHVWAGFTDEARGHGLAIFKLTRHLLDEVMKHYRIILCYTWNHEGALENDKWMKMLGFVRAPAIDETEKGHTMKGYTYGLFETKTERTTRH